MNSPDIMSQYEGTARGGEKGGIPTLGGVGQRQTFSRETRLRQWIARMSRWAVLGFSLVATLSLSVASEAPPLEVVFQLPLAPAGLTVAPDGAFLLSISFQEKPQNRVVAVNKKGESRPFPTLPISQASKEESLLLDAVEGLHADKNGTVWMVDNGRRSELPPKLVAWDFDHNKLQRVIHLAPPSVLPDSLLHDLAVDPEYPFVYLSDPANGSDAALIVVDIGTGLGRRILQGHPSVVPEEGTQLEIDGQKHQTLRLDGSVANTQGGVSALALDRKGEWLYFGPMRSRRLYRIRTEHLRNVALAQDKLAGLVEEYASKPICNGISIDSKGNIYVSDVGAKGVGMIAAGTKQYRLLATDSRVFWPDGLCFGTDGKLYFFTNSRKGRAGEAMTASLSAPEAPMTNYLFRLTTVGSGRVGD